MLAIASRLTSSYAEMGFPRPKRRQQQQKQQKSPCSSSSPSSSSSRDPTLDRRNAVKNIENETSTAFLLPFSSPEESSTRSLGVSPSDLTSFRIEGIDGEVDLLCRSLGLSGPEDFAIPADAWAAIMARSISEGLPRSRLFDLPDIASMDSDDMPPHSPDTSAAAIKFGDHERNGLKSETKSHSGSSGSDGGIRGARPPVLLPPTPPIALLPLPPARSRPVLECTVSTWDLLRSFAPEGAFVGDQAMEIQEREVEDRELMLEETVEDLNDSCSSFTHEDDSSSTTTETMFVISPNGRFKRSIRSWMRGGLLGSGSFGTVYEGISDDGFFFAVKEVSLLDKGSDAKQCILQLEQEIALLSQFEHENIVQYFGTDKEDSKLYIFLELVTQGSLASLYQRYRLRDSQVSAYTRQILNGLNYLHERNVVHRDIKCANILVDASGSVKLADFGLAKEITKLNMLKSCKGSVYWMAPEVVNPKRSYGPSADIWSLGCTVLEMLTRQVPYPNLEWAQAFFKIGHGEPPPVPSSFSKDARNFIQMCVRVDPEERPTATQLLEHPFVKRPIL